MIYDILGIGIGPFNLGLAALLDEIPGLSCLFIDAKETFNWHPGLMIDNARMQVPFYADLVTLANPCSKYSYLNFLKNKERLFRFAIHEHYFPTRKEYNAYCQWVVSQLSLQFNKTCTGIFYSKQKQCYGVQLRDNKSRNTICYWTKHIVIGTGTVPAIPGFAKDIEHPLLFHSADYLNHKPQLLKEKSITIVGSGQSAAEIFNDLLETNHQRNSLNWFTWADRFFPMEYSKLTLEMSSPGYIDYFYKLSSDKKRMLLKDQDSLYKGINFSLINEIYDKLYLDSLDDTKGNKKSGLHTSCGLQKISVAAGDQLLLQFKHKYSEIVFEQLSGAVILATGYKNTIPDFLNPVKELINWTADGLYNLQRDYSISKKGKTIFVQNADLTSHGFNSADLGLGPYRNAVIINTILEQDYFPMEKNIAFQHFGVPD